MARYKTVVEISAPIAGQNLLNLVGGASANGKVRRITFGVRTAGVPTSQNVTIGGARATARGTATTTKTPGNMDPRSAPSAMTGVDTAWSAQPTLAATNLDDFSFNTQSAMDYPQEFTEEEIVDQGSANGYCLFNIGNAFPAGHTLTITLEHEE